MSNSLNLVKNQLDEIPNNIEAEQSVIGSILLSNEIFDEISILISSKNFYDAMHQKIFRAIENDTFLIRSANQGVTAIISNKGEIVKKLNTYEAGNIELQLPIIESSNIKIKKSLIFYLLLITYVFIFFILRKFKI